MVKHDRKWSGGRILSRIGFLLGFHCGAKKDADGSPQMFVLGVTVARGLRRCKVFTRICAKKAYKWSVAFLASLAACHMEAWEALRDAGRMNSALTLSASKGGRAYLKALLCSGP